MADVSQLNLRAPDAGIDYEGSESDFSLPSPVDADGNNIIFTLQVGDVVENTRVASGENEGAFMVILKTLKVVSPCECEADLAWQYVSSAPFKKSPKRSPMSNYLKAAGVSIANGPANEVLSDACAATKGRILQAVLDWGAYDADTRTSYDGYMNFPLSTSGDGTRHPGLKPKSTFGDGALVQSTPLRAKLKVRWFVGAAA